MSMPILRAHTALRKLEAHLSMPVPTALGEATTRLQEAEKPEMAEEARQIGNLLTQAWSRTVALRKTIEALMLVLLLGSAAHAEPMGPPAPRPRHEAAVRVVSVERFVASHAFAHRVNVASTAAATFAFIHTEIDLSRGDEFRELNPLMRNRWARRVGKPLLTVFAIRTLNRLARSPADDDHALLRVLGWIGLAWNVADAVSHLRH